VLDIHAFPWWEVPSLLVLKALERVRDPHSRSAALFLLRSGVRKPEVIAAALLHHAKGGNAFPEEVWDIVEGRREESFLLKLACAWARPPKERLRALKGLQPPQRYLPLYLSALIRAKMEAGVSSKGKAERVDGGEGKGMEEEQEADPVRDGRSK